MTRRLSLSLLAPLLMVACRPGATVPSGLMIASLAPSSGPLSASVTIHGSGFSATENTITFGSGVIPNLASDGSILIFAVPMFRIPACAYSSTPCPFALVTTAPGACDVSVTNAMGTSNTVTFTVITGVSPSAK